MDPIVSLSPTRVDVAPGGEATVRVTVRNPADLVVEYDVEVLGQARRWTEATPSRLSLLTAEADPDRAEAAVELTFRPPRAPAAPVGEIPFGVRCVSREGQDHCAVEEGVVVVSAVSGLAADLRPVGRRGRRAGHFGLVLRNTGTAPLTVTVEATDQAQRLRFAVGPAEVELPPGQARTVYVAVRPRELIWLGRPVEHSFTVAHRVAGASEADARTATYEQRPVIPRWLLVAAAVVVLALVLVLVIWNLGAPRGEGAGDEAAAAQPLPAVAGVGAVAGEEPGEVVVTWRASPYALKGYRVWLLDESGEPRLTETVAEPDQASFVWEGLAGGSQCFEVVVVAADETAVGARSGQPSCVDVVAAEPSDAPSDAASGAAATAEPSDAPLAGGDPAAGAAGGGEPGASTTGQAPAPPDPTLALRRWFVLYRSEFKADTVARGELQDYVAELQRAGVSAQLVDGAFDPRLSEDQWHVVEDDFPDWAAARSRCDDLAELAPSCVVGARPVEP